MADDLPIREFADAAAFDGWIAADPEAPGLWLKLAKKGHGAVRLTKQQAIDTALCCGWIDGQLRPFDATHWLVRFTPRRSASKWSEINRSRAEALIAEGRMTPRGQAEIDRARADGRWDAAYAPQSRAEVPAELAAALAANPAAAATFGGLDRHNRYALIYRSQSPKTREARARRAAALVADLARGVLPFPKAP